MSGQISENKSGARNFTATDDNHLWWLKEENAIYTYFFGRQGYITDGRKKIATRNSRVKRFTTQQDYCIQLSQSIVTIP